MSKTLIEFVTVEKDLLERLRDATRWIPVGDRLPAQCVQVLIFVKSPRLSQCGVHLAQYEPEDDTDPMPWREKNGGWFDASYVTHWKAVDRPEGE